MNWLLHLWAHAPLGATVPCPAPREGEPPDPAGLYDALAMASLWNRMAIISALTVLVLVLCCYLLPRTSLGPRFVRDWWFGLGVAALSCFLIPFVMGLTTEMPVRAGSCSTRPASFLVDFPTGLVMDRMFAGLVWGVLAFLVLSLLGTKVLGQSRRAGGFFHYRGCPWPRWNPTQG